MEPMVRKRLGLIISFLLAGFIIVFLSAGCTPQEQPPPAWEAA